MPPIPISPPRPSSRAFGCTAQGKHLLCVQPRPWPTACPTSQVGITATRRCSGPSSSTTSCTVRSADPTSTAKAITDSSGARRFPGYDAMQPVHALASPSTCRRGAYRSLHLPHRRPRQRRDGQRDARERRFVRSNSWRRTTRPFAKFFCASPPPGINKSNTLSSSARMITTLPSGRRPSLPVVTAVTTRVLHPTRRSGRQPAGLLAKGKGIRRRSRSTAISARTCTCQGQPPAHSAAVGLRACSGRIEGNYDPTGAATCGDQNTWPIRRANVAPHGHRDPAARPRSPCSPNPRLLAERRRARRVDPDCDRSRQTPGTRRTSPGTSTGTGWPSWPGSPPPRQSTVWASETDTRPTLHVLLRCTTTYVHEPGC